METWRPCTLTLNLIGAEVTHALVVDISDLCLLRRGEQDWVLAWQWQLLDLLRRLS